MNVRALIANVCAQTGMPVPPSVAASQDRTIQQMMALLSQLGAELVTMHPWQRLIREQIIRTQAFTVSASATEGSNLISVPAGSGLNDQWIATGDGIPPFAAVVSSTATTVQLNQPATKTGPTEVMFYRYAHPMPQDWQRQIPATEYNRTDIRPVYGPQTSHSWQKARANVVYSGQDVFRIANGQLQLLYPVPNGLTMAYEYISKNWVVGNGGGQKSSITMDDDEFIFSDSLLMTGLKARWFDAHGMDSTIEKADFAGLLNLEKAQNAGAKTLSVSPSWRFPSPTVPDGNWMV